MDSVCVRVSVSEDSEAIYSFIQQNSKTTNNPWKTSYEAFRKDGYTNGRFVCIVAEKDMSGERVILGCSVCTRMYMCWHGGHLLHVEEMVVGESHRRTGVATAMFNTIVQHAEEKGYLRIQMLARKDNLPAMKFLKKMNTLNETEQFEWNTVKIFEDEILSRSGKLNRTPSTDQFTTRKAGLDDSEQLFNLLHTLAVYEDCEGEFTTDLHTLRRDGYEEKKLFECLVVEEKNANTGRCEIVGYILYTWIYKAHLGRDIMYIEDLFVAENRRRSGIGTLLFDKAFQIAAEKGYRFLQLTVRENNTAAMKFYKKHGAVDVSLDEGVQYIVFDRIQGSKLNTPPLCKQ